MANVEPRFYSNTAKESAPPILLVCQPTSTSRGIRSVRISSAFLLLTQVTERSLKTLRPLGRATRSRKAWRLRSPDVLSRKGLTSRIRYGNAQY